MVKFPSGFDTEIRSPTFASVLNQFDAFPFSTALTATESISLGALQMEYERLIFSLFKNNSKVKYCPGRKEKMLLTCSGTSNETLTALLLKR